MQVNRK